jgi:hypothetical protein
MGKEFLIYKKCGKIEILLKIYCFGKITSKISRWRPI